MFLSAWVLFCTLAIANLQRIAMKDSEDDQAELCNELKINENFLSTMFAWDPSQGKWKYCYQLELNGTAPDFDEPIDLDEVIDLYKTFAFANSYEHVTPNSPITQTGVLSINDHQEVPLFLKADIRHRHIRSNPASALGDDSDEQMALMGQLTTDVRACLLPHSIGGARGINVVPMAQKVYRNPDDKTDANSGYLPYWKDIEDYIINFLQTYPEGRVAWSVAVQYEEFVVSDPVRHRAYRPVAFALDFPHYKNQSVESLYEGSGRQITFRNDNDDPCGEDFINQLIPVPPGCKSSDDPTQADSNALGKEMSSDTLKVAYVISIPYSIENRTFFYGQCVMDGRQWFIQELLPLGKLGEKISRGKRDFYYKTVFIYSINDRYFLYSHRGTGGTYWFIQELLPEGQMGSKMSDGTWAYAHHVSIPFTIDGRQFFYGQIESINKWFIRELLPGGMMGNVTHYGNHITQVVMIYEYGGIKYLYSHDPYLVIWVSKEVRKGGKLSPIINMGFLNVPHHTSVTFNMTVPVFYGQNLHGGYWSITELGPWGSVGNRTAHGISTDRYEVVFAYKVGGKQFLYFHSQTTKAYVITELV